MFKGFYNLTSGMLTQGRRLDVISNNMANIATNGYKSDRFMYSTFDQVMWSMVGNKNKNYEDIGEMSYITAPDEIVTDFSQGSYDETGMPLDFAIEGDGYFGIQTDDGTVYTRAGSFTLDDEAYLYFSDKGRVIDVNGQPIRIMTDKIEVDDKGRIYAENGALLGQIGVFSFGQDAELEKDPYGFINGGQAQPTEDIRVLNGMTERSNVDLVREMTEMIDAQRAYQSVAEVTKIYDQVMTRATTDIGRLS